VLGRVGYCPEVLLIDAGVPDRLALYARPVADHVRQQDHLVINHPLCVERLGYTARYGDSSADFESAESPPPVEREKRAISLRLQLPARSQPQFERFPWPAGVHRGQLPGNQTVPLIHRPHQRPVTCPMQLFAHRFSAVVRPQDSSASDQH
jgi:hypothetical protein